MTKRPAESYPIGAPSRERPADDEMVQVRADALVRAGVTNCECGRCGRRQTDSQVWTKMAPWGWVCEGCKATLVAYYQQGTGSSGGGGGGTDSSVGGPRSFAGGISIIGDHNFNVVTLTVSPPSGCGGPPGASTSAEPPGGSCADVEMSSAATPVLVCRNHSCASHSCAE